jgi:hypothetical protein
MKIAVFFLYLFFHLLGGGNVDHAVSHGNVTASDLQAFLSNRSQVKAIKTVPIGTLLTTAEFDLEEESSSSDSFKVTNTSISDGKYHLLQVWYQRFSCQSLLNYYHQNCKIFSPSCGQSNPIYILQRVLRI